MGVRGGGKNDKKVGWGKLWQDSSKGIIYASIGDRNVISESVKVFYYVFSSFQQRDFVRYNLRKMPQNI